MSGDLISKSALMEDIRNTITEMSSTMDWLNLINRQPVVSDNGWIPCSKSLPQSNNTYNYQHVHATVKYKENGYVHVREVLWSNYHKCWVWPNKRKVSDAWKIIAWQPIDLPEPYKEE